MLDPFIIETVVKLAAGLMLLLAFPILVCAAQYWIHYPFGKKRKRRNHR